MSEFERYQAWEAKRKAALIAQTNVILNDARQTKPDEFASDAQLGRAFGIPTGVAAEGRDILRARLDKKMDELRLTHSPTLMRWLRNPDHAKAAHDDLDNLSLLETIGRNAKEAVKAIPGGVVQRIGGTVEGAGQLISTRNPTEPLPLTASIAAAKTRSPEDIAVLRQQIFQQGQINPTVAQSVLSDVLAGDMTAEEALSALEPALAPISKALQEGGQATSEFGETILPAAPGMENSFGREVGAGLGSMLPLIAIGLATGGTGLVLAGGAGGAGEAAQRARGAGQDEDTQTIAALYGVLPGLTDAIPIDRLLSNPVTKRGVASILRSIGVQAAQEGGQEVVQQMMQNAIAQYLYAPDQEIMDGVVRSFQVGGFTGALVEAGRIGLNAVLPGRLRNQQAAAQQAPEAVAQLDQIAQAAQASKLRTRLDSSFADFVEQATQGSPVENVFVPAEKMAEFFQSRGVDPEEFLRELPGTSKAEYDLALSTGGDLKIPTSTYAAKIAGSDFDPFLRENMRFDPDGMTLTEAREFNERSAEAIQEAYEEAERLRLEEQDLRSDEVQIYDEMVSRLRAAGRATDVATNEAMVWPAFYRAMAARSGMTTEELLRAFPLPQIEGMRPEGLQPKNVDAFNRTLAELRSRKADTTPKQSLLEFIDKRGGINDPGGELAARDAATVRRGQGKKTLRLRRGMAGQIKDMFAERSHGLDDTARAAIEEGFMADDPRVQAWKNAVAAGDQVPDVTGALLEAIDRELAGDAEYRQDAFSERERARQDALDAADEFLTRRGISLEQDDETIRAAIDAAEKEAGRRYEQRRVEVVAEIRDLIEFAGTAPGTVTKKVRLGAVSPLVQEAVKEGLGLNLAGFSHDVDAHAIRHIRKQHGNPAREEARGQLAISDADFEAIPDIIANAEYLVTGGKNNLGQPVIGYVTKLADGSFAYLEEVRTGRKTLSALSLRKYPATSNSLGIAKSIAPNVQDDSGDGRKIIPLGGKAKTLFQPGDRGPLGSIRMPMGGVGSGETIISLFERADLSTFLHETGHMFLSIAQAVSEQPNASPEIQGMYASVKAWWRDNAGEVAKDASRSSGIVISAEDVQKAIDEGTTGDAVLDQAIDVGMQEQFARAFETYVMEGNAPSIELRSAFERFRAWLLNIYRRVAGLGVNVSPELREVFDRMLATDAEIEQARAEVRDEMLFSNAADAGLTDEQYAGLVELRRQASDEAAQKLLKETMAPIRRAREQWFKDERAKVRDEVAGQVNARREYRALEWLGNRRWLGGERPEAMPDMRLSRSILVERYGEGVLKTLPRGQFHVYAVDGGMDPDEVAGWFGFSSGDEMVRALETAQPRKEAIEAETDRIMRERHGDVLRDGSVEEAALEAIHGDKRGQYLAAELNALGKVTQHSEPALTLQGARESARRSLARMQVRDAIASNRYLAAERKAAGEALALAKEATRAGLLAQAARRNVGKVARSAVRSEDARGVDRINAATDAANVRVDTANDAIVRMIQAKRRQLLNHALYAESMKIAEEVEKAENFVRRLGKASTRKNLAGDYLDAIDEVLDRYDFRKLSGRQEAKRGALMSYVQRMMDEGRGNELAIPDYVIAEARRTPYKRLSVEYLRGVVDSLKNIEHTARLKKSLLDAKGKRDLDAVVDDILASFDTNMKQRPVERAKSARGKVRPGFVDYLNLIRNADTLLREVDGFKDGGAVYTNIKGPIDDAMAELTIKRRDAAERFDRIYSVYSKQERRQMAVHKFVPELAGSYTKWDLISIALNIGNEGNYQRLTDKRVQGAFLPQQIDLVAGMLDERDWKFVQSAWDMIDSYWPDIEARERRVTGVAPEKIVPRAVETPFGTFRGGYYPLKYDAEISSLSRDDDLHETAKAMQGGRFGKAQTRNGHLKERAASSGRPVLIDLAVMHGHINQVVHDLALSEVVSNSWKILQDRRVRDAFMDSGAKGNFDTLEAWLLDVAAGEIRAGDFMNRWARKLKTGFTVSKLAFNLKTVLLQPAGVTQSMVVVGKKNFLLGVTDIFRNPLIGPNSAASQITAKSVFMKERETTFNKDIYDVLGDTRSGPTQNAASAFVRDVIAPLGFWLMQKVQFYIVDMPTWLAGYRKALDEGADETEAVARADRSVARAQASGHFSDRTAIERGTLNQSTRQNDIVRLFTALASYMFAKFNVAYERTQVARRNITGMNPRSAGEALLWSADMAMLFTLEAVLFAALTGALPGMGDDEEDDDGWTEFLAKQTALSVAGTLPFVRDGASFAQGFSGGGAYGGMVETMVKPFMQASQGEIDRAFVKSVVDVSGMFLNLPSTAVNRGIDAAWRAAEGEEVAPSEFLIGRQR